MAESTKESSENIPPAHAVHEEIIEHQHEAPKRIIAIPIDPSNGAQTALQWAIDHVVHPTQDQVILLHVREPSAPLGFGNPYIDYGELVDRVEESNREASHSLLKNKGEQLVQKNISTRAIALRGDPRIELCRKIQELKVDMVIIGSRGMGVLKRALLGSVSDYLLHHSHCPVVVVKP